MAKPKNQAVQTTNQNETKPKRPGNNKHVNFMQENVKPGDNTRYLRMARAPLALPPIDISDPKQIEDRINLYFTFCENNDRKPSLIGIANWLGVHRDTLNSWKRGEYRSGTHSDVVEKAVTVLEELWVDYMQNGLVNPVSGIFLGKVLFGYREKQEIVVKPENPLGEQYDQKQLEERIAGEIVAEE
jgi:hypothetical protein